MYTHQLQLTIPKQSFQQSSRPVARQFGTAFPKARVASRSTAVYDALKTRRAGASLVASSFVATQQLRIPSQQRYASTQPAQPAAPPPPAAPAPATPDALPTDVSATTNVDLSNLDILNMPEQIGYLKAMGLDYGWGPTAMMEYLLEHVYIYTGLPWWASIVTVGVLIRAALFMPSIKAADTSFKMQELRKNPKYEALRKMSMDFQNPDPTKMAAARQELSAFHKAHGVEMWRTFIPMLNMPLLYGFFRLFRGMAELPVPTLETGGVLWFTDLSAQDPYYIMPIASAVTLFFVMRVSTNLSWHYCSHITNSETSRACHTCRLNRPT
jgi:YidC/Oxa1 family membrane protein insertase